MHPLSYEVFLHHSKKCVDYEDLPNSLSKEYFLFVCFSPPKDECHFFRFRICKWNKEAEVCIGGGPASPEIKFDRHEYRTKVFAKKVI